MAYGTLPPVPGGTRDDLAAEAGGCGDGAVCPGWRRQPRRGPEPVAHPQSAAATCEVVLMAVGRRCVVKNLSRVAAAGAAGGLLGACSGSGTGAGGDGGAAGQGGGAGQAAAGAATSTAPAAGSIPSRLPAAGAATPAPKSPSFPPDLPDQVRHGPRTRPLVALTFHGQGDPGLADAILTTAEHAGAHVTVLAVGTWLDTYPAVAHRVLSGGHDLGNHTQNHLDISAMSADDAYREIDACAQRLHRLTGSIGTWFRPSRAELATPLVLRLARKAGYARCLSYDVDSLDYTDPGAGAVRDTVLSAARAGSVVSMHMGHQGTLDALPAILDGLGKRGLHAVTATAMLRA
jgi:peptidoglycan/xylan/chitin deacetylase (PgdA/CDA1 family)